MKKRVYNYLGKVTKRIEPLSIAALVSFIMLSLTVSLAVSPLPGESELYGNIIRFHVLANSDSEDDQELKLKVRDEVTDYTSKILEGCTSIDEARNVISENSDRIVDIARRVISENGCGYDVTMKQGMEIYPKRIYGKYTFPAGEYYSVRIEIGKANGKNWWCVLFPPMCLGGATAEKYDNAERLSDIGFSDNEIKLISDGRNAKREIRFFFLDLLNFKK